MSNSNWMPLDEYRKKYGTGDSRRFTEHPSSTVMKLRGHRVNLDQMIICRRQMISEGLDTRKADALIKDVEIAILELMFQL